MTALLTAPPAPAPAPPPAPPAWPALYRFTVDQYHAMITAGVVPEGNSLEFIHGLVVRKMPKNAAHCFASRRLGARLQAMIPPPWGHQAQDPITLTDSEPEPDHSVCLASVLEAARRHPRADEVALAAEVADSTLATDRAVKKALYASERIPVYWIVNLPERQIEVYTSPSGPGPTPDYSTRTDCRPGDEVPVVLMGVEVGRIPVSDLLP